MYRIRTPWRRSLATLEMALILPLMLLLTLAAMEYGWMFLKSQQVADISRRAARIAILDDANNAAVLSGVASDMADAGLSASGYTVVFTPSDVSSARTGDVLTVKVRVPYASGIGLLKLPMVPVPDYVSSAVSMSKEGP